MPLSFKLKGLLKAQQDFRKIEAKLKNMRAVNLKAATVVVTWVHRNFKQNGRLHDESKFYWKGLSDATKNLRRKGSGKGDPQILRDTGRLFGAFIPKSTQREGVVDNRTTYAQNHEQDGGFTTFFAGKKRRVPQRKMFPTDRQGLKIVTPVYEKYIDKIERQYD